MRVLVAPAGAAVPPGRDADRDLAGLYAPPRLPWLRVNMVSTLDGAAAGADGLTGSINNPADKRVFSMLRATCDAIVVGAGTARAEGYGPARAPIVLVSRRGEVPERLRDAAPGRVLMATVAAAPNLAEARAVLGGEQVLVAGEHEVDLVAVVAALHERGLRHLLSEGGPALLGSLLAAGLVDELDATVVPHLVGGTPGRIVDGPALDVPLHLHTVLEENGTLLGRWVVDRPAPK